jgi:hypothetical protein
LKDILGLGNIRGVLGAYSENTQGIFGEYSGNIRDIFRRIFGEYSQRAQEEIQGEQGIAVGHEVEKRGQYRERGETSLR